MRTIHEAALITGAMQTLDSALAAAVPSFTFGITALKCQMPKLSQPTNDEFQAFTVSHLRATFLIVPAGLIAGAVVCFLEVWGRTFMICISAKGRQYRNISNSNRSTIRVTKV